MKTSYIRELMRRSTARSSAPRAAFADDEGRCDFCGGWDSWHAFGLAVSAAPEWMCEECCDAELRGELDERATIQENDERGGGAGAK